MLHPAQWILKHGPSIITPFNSNMVNPASYDVTLNRNVLVKGDEDALLPIKLMPHEFIIATTNEFFVFPLDLAGELRLKSTIGRMGVSHCLSVFFDPGFRGQGTLELYNASNTPVVLNPDIKIAQMLFIPLSESTELSYADTGRYCGQIGPTPARSERIDKKVLS